jgi:hypothetical protein
MIPWISFLLINPERRRFCEMMEAPRPLASGNLRSVENRHWYSLAYPAASLPYLQIKLPDPAKRAVGNTLAVRFRAGTRKGRSLCSNRSGTATCCAIFRRASPSDRDEAGTDPGAGTKPARPRVPPSGDRRLATIRCNHRPVSIPFSYFATTMFFVLSNPSIRSR